VEYQSTVFALKAAGVSKISFDNMIQRLKETEISLNKILKKEINLARAVGYRHDRGRKQESNRLRRQQRDRRDIECHHYHKKGYYKKDCWSLNGKTNSREHQQ
jgi:hypothetical protein